MILNDFISVIQIIIQLVAAYIAFLIGRSIGNAIFWWSLILAFLLMALRRVTALMINKGLLQSFDGALAMFDRVYLPLLISIFLLVAMIDLRRRLSKN